MKATRTTPLQLAKLLRGAAVDKKAWDTVVLDVRDKTSIAELTRQHPERRIEWMVGALPTAYCDRSLMRPAIQDYLKTVRDA